MYISSSRSDVSIALKNSTDKSMDPDPRSPSQIKMAEINQIVQANLALLQEIKETIPAQIDFKKVVTSNDFKKLIIKIKKENYFYNETIQDIPDFAISKAEQLNEQLINNGVKSWQFTSAFYFLYIHMGLWFYATNEKDQDISSISKNEFYFLPNEFTGATLKISFRSLVFNPLEKDVKKHLFHYLITAFVKANPKPKISFDEFIKQKHIIELIDDLVLASQVIKETIHHKNYHILCKYRTSNFIDETEIGPWDINFRQSSYVDKFEIELKSFKFFNNYLISTSPYDFQKTEVNPHEGHQNNAEEETQPVATHMYWFNKNKYNEIIQEINKSQRDNVKLCNLFVEKYLNLLRHLIQCVADMHQAKKGVLTYKSWVKRMFDQTPPDDTSNYKFRSQLKYQYHLLNYFKYSFLQLFTGFADEVSLIFSLKGERFRFTHEIVKYYLDSNKSRNMEVKHPLVNELYLSLDIFLNQINLMGICDIYLLLKNDKHDWFDKIRSFLVIEDECQAFRDFSKVLSLYNVKLQKFLLSATTDEKAVMEREYDLVKSHFMLPIFILNSITIMEAQFKKIYVVDKNKSVLDIPLENLQGGSYLDEINHFFVDECFFHPHDVPQKIDEKPIDDLSSMDRKNLDISPQAESHLQEARDVSPLAPAENKSLEPKEPDLPETLPSESAQKLTEKLPTILPLKIPKLAVAKFQAPQEALVPLPIPAQSEVSFSRGIKVRKLIKELLSLGFDLNHKTGSHAIFKLNKQQLVVPTSKDTLPRGTLESIEDRVNAIVNNNTTQS